MTVQVIKTVNGMSNLLSVLVLTAQLVNIIQKFRQQLAAIIDRLGTEFVVTEVQTIVGIHWNVGKANEQMIQSKG